MLERLYTLQELVVLLKLSMSTLRREIRTGNLECAKAGRRGLIRVSESAVTAFLARSTAGSRAPDGLGGSSGEMPRNDPASVNVRKGHVGANLSYRILNADVLVGLRTLPLGAANCAVTSPPYFWQRDYGIEGQIGHEA